MADDAGTLTYAPVRQRPVLGWIGRHRKGLVLVTLLGVIGWAGWRYHGPVGEWFAWQRAMRACMEFEMPEEGFAQFVDPAQASISDYHTEPSWSNHSYQPAAYVDLVLNDRRTFAIGDLGAIGGVNRQFDSGGVVFLGSLERPDGVERLVVLKAGLLTNALRLADDLKLLVLPAPGWTKPEASNHGGWASNSSGAFAEGRLHLARKDPENPYRMTMAFDVGRRSWGSTEFDPGGVIELELTNDDSLIVRFVEGTVDPASGFGLTWRGLDEIELRNRLQ